MYEPTPENMRLAATAVHLVAPKEAAEDISAMLLAGADAIETPRDEHHTMQELYHYRLLYNAALFNEWDHSGSVKVRKSTRHSDGELCFGGGWFVVVAELPTGQITNHYKLEHWDLFYVPAVDRAPEYDGHTPAVAAERLLTYVKEYQ
jgi:hypothetical protein